MLIDPLINILQCLLTVTIDNNLNPPLWYLILINVALNKLPRLLRRIVINVHHMILLVVLHENRV